jgi:sugar lactone lactonase YvrE
VTALRIVAPGPLMRRLGGWLGVSEGHAYTLVIGLVVAMTTAAIGIPPTLRHRISVASSSPALLPTTTAEKALTVAGATVPAGGADAQTPAAVFPTSVPFVATPSARASASPSAEAAAPTSTATSPPSFADDGALGEVHPLVDVGDPGAPEGVAVDPATGEFYVGTDNGTAEGKAGPSKVLAYSAAGALTREYVVTGQRSAQANGLTGLALDGAGGLYALDASTSRVLRIELASGLQENVARIPDVPVCSPADQAGMCELSPQDAAPLPRAAALDAAGSLFVSDTSQGIVWKVSRAGQVSLWDKSVDFVGPTGAGPAGLAFDAKGQLVLGVSESLVALTGAVYVVPVDASGAASNHTRLWQSNPGDKPTGVALGRSGKVYVTSTGTNALLVLNPDGSVFRTITSSAFGTPTGIAFRGHSVLITNTVASTAVRAPVAEPGLTDS